MPRLKSLLWSSFFIFSTYSELCHGLNLKNVASSWGSLVCSLPASLTTGRGAPSSELSLLCIIMMAIMWPVMSQPSELSHATAGWDLACNERRRSHSRSCNQPSIGGHPGSCTQSGLFDFDKTMMYGGWAVGETSRDNYFVAVPSLTTLHPRPKVVPYRAPGSTYDHDHTQNSVIDRTCLRLSSCLVFYNMLLFSGVHSGSLLET